MIRQVIGRIKTISKVATRSKMDCLDLIRSDHMKLEAMLVELRLIKEPEHRKKLFRRIRADLLKHMKIEEDYFYPECNKIQEMRELIDHAHADHQWVKDVLSDLNVIGPKTKRYSTLVSKLILNIERHVVDEENRIFSAVRKYMPSADFKRMNQNIIKAHAGIEAPRLRRAA